MNPAIPTPDYRLLELLSATQAHSFQAVPLSDENGVLQLGIPAQHQPAKAPLTFLLGRDLAFVELDPESWERLLHQSYPLPKQEKPIAPKKEMDAITQVNNMILEALNMGGSDLHFERYEEEARLRIRWEGQLIEKRAIPLDQYNSLISRIKILSQLDIAEKRLPQDGRMQLDCQGRKVDIRVSTLPNLHGEKAVLRLLDRKPAQLQLEKLGMPEQELKHYQQAIQKPHGMILITGPTGSGKTSTLYASLAQLNEPSKNILTIEDPVEYHLSGINQVQVKPEIGLTFESALRSFLRQDPDIIMVGEIRDLPTAQIALRAALTGHLVFSTLHTNGAWETVARLTDMGLPAYLIAAALRCLVAQRLVRLLCPQCKIASTERSPSGKEAFQPKGCPRCQFTGFSGRKAVFEVIPIQGSILSFIREGKADIQDFLRTQGIRSLRSNLECLVDQGKLPLTSMMLVE